MLQSINIVAIGSGILYELTKSSSSLATYLTKALQEITNTKILYGTIGDYYMTSTSFNSRNFTFGTLIAKNRIEAQNYLANNTVEGYDMLKTLKSYLTSQSQFVSIINILYDIIYENKKETILLDYLK